MSRRSPLLAVAAALVAGCALAQPEPSTVLVGDADAGFAANDNAGAIFEVDLSAPDSQAPGVLAAADLGAGFVNISAVSLSPFDGRLYITDLGESPLASTLEPGLIWAVAADGTVSLVASDPVLAAPSSMSWLPDGRLLVADPQADPSSLGTDRANNPGHGAIFAVDVSTGAVSVLADGTNRGTMEGFQAGTSAFDEPMGVAYDWSRDVVWVSDTVASPLAFASSGAIYRVDAETGFVSVASAAQDLDVPNGIDVLRDGRVAILERGSFDSFPAVLVMQPGGDPEFNVETLSTGWQEGIDSGLYGFLEGISVGPSGDVFLADSGELADDGMGGVVVVSPPRIFRFDPLVLGGSDRAVAGIVNDAAELAFPTGVAAGPAFEITGLSPAEIPDVAPTGCAGNVDVLVTGFGLVPALDLDLGPHLSVTSVEVASDADFGTQLLVRATPTGSNGSVTVSATHPFGGSSSLADAAEVIDVGAAPGSPGPPCSDRGDANCDGVVDGIDLAILGMHFGESFCANLTFDNDADFNDDDAIDGEDLAILATFFGIRL